MITIIYFGQDKGKKIPSFDMGENKNILKF